MILIIIVAVILVIMGVLILIGKGDNLIAGYNTASPKEKAQYNIRRLRGLIGGLLIVLAPMLFLLRGEDDGCDLGFRGPCVRAMHRCSHTG